MEEVIEFGLTRAEIELLTHALDSHVLWISDDADRPDEGDEEVIASRELGEKLVALLLS